MNKQIECMGKHPHTHIAFTHFSLWWIYGGYKWQEKKKRIMCQKVPNALLSGLAKLCVVKVSITLKMSIPG